MDKYNIEYYETSLENKPIFLFVNHKTSILCWAKIKEDSNKKLDVLTFDSHGDFHGGGINGENLIKSDLFFGSKYLTHLPHFTKCEEFINWNLLDDEKNRVFINEENKFLFINNDNFIDVAFMKNIVNNVFWYYLNLQGNHESGKCDGVKNSNHLFIRKNVKNLKQPLKPFILDIDLDFFVKENENNFNCSLISNKEIEENLTLQKKLFSNKLCLSLTIALEQDCCGGIENCLRILKKLEEVFKLDLLEKAKELIENSK